MKHYQPYHDPFKFGAADFIMGRPCCSPWKHGNRSMNDRYVKGYLYAQDKKEKKMQYQINDETYTINDYDEDGFSWDRGATFYPTALEALQAAIDCEQDKVIAELQEHLDALDAKKYGTYEDQVHSQYTGGLL